MNEQNFIVTKVCPKCYGDKTFQPTGVEEIYRCPVCLGEGTVPSGFKIGEWDDWEGQPAFCEGCPFWTSFGDFESCSRCSNKKDVCYMTDQGKEVADALTRGMYKCGECENFKTCAVTQHVDPFDPEIDMANWWPCEVWSERPEPVTKWEPPPRPPTKEELAAMPPSHPSCRCNIGREIDDA
jgi:hypothetical protein